MSIYGVTRGPDGWYVTLQNRDIGGPVETWDDAQEVADELNQENAAPANHAKARQKTGPCEPGTGLGEAEHAPGASPGNRQQCSEEVSQATETWVW